MARITRAALAAALVLAACGRLPEDLASARPTTRAQAADPYRALLEHYHWTPQESPRVLSVAIPQPEAWNSAEGQPFNFYLAASRSIGLDFMPWAGQTLELRTYLLGGTMPPQHAIYGQLLGDERQVVGAWLSVDAEAPGIYPLNLSIEELIYLAPGYRSVEMVAARPFDRAPRHRRNTDGEA